MNYSDAKLLNMADLVQSGEGANGASYDLVSDPSMMVKLYNEGYDTSTIFTELDAARKVYELGIPSPKPGELVTDGVRYGIMFRRIVGKRSYSRMLADEPERYDEFAREFARYCKMIHTTECPEDMFPDAKPQFLHLLQADKVFNDHQKAVMADFIKSMPDSNTALHGDMHMGNAISTLPFGAPLSTPHDVYFIDLGYFAHGCPLLDLGMLMNICLISDDGFRFHDFHIHREVTAPFWASFVDEYFFGPDKAGVKWFGPAADPAVSGFDAALKAVYEGMLPYYSIKMLLVEYNLNGFLPDPYPEVIRSTFKF